MPLYHFVTGDLPGGTRAPELDDTRTQLVLAADAKAEGAESAAARGSSVTEELMGVYLAYLAAVGFLSAPPQGGQAKPLPRSELSDEQVQALGKVGGRGSLG